MASFLFVTQYLCESIFTTKIWEKESEMIRSKMNDSVATCNNFFDFSCGKYKPVIPSHKTSVTELDLIHDTLQERLNITMSADISENDIEPFKNLKVFFRNCMKKGF